MPHSSMQSYLFTSLGRHICHVTNHVRMYKCEYGPVKYEPSCMTPDITLELKFILALEPVSYQLVMAYTVFVLVLTVACMPLHRSLLLVFVQAQFHPSTTTSNSLFALSIHICFDAIPSFSSNSATSSSAQPPLRSEMHIRCCFPISPAVEGRQTWHGHLC